MTSSPDAIGSFVEYLLIVLSDVSVSAYCRGHWICFYVPVWRIKNNYFITFSKQSNIIYMVSLEAVFCVCD